MREKEITAHIRTDFRNSAFSALYLRFRHLFESVGMFTKAMSKLVREFFDTNCTFYFRIDITIVFSSVKSIKAKEINYFFNNNNYTFFRKSNVFFVLGYLQCTLKWQ